MSLVYLTMILKVMTWSCLGRVQVMLFLKRSFLTIFCHGCNACVFPVFIPVVIYFLYEQVENGELAAFFGQFVGFFVYNIANISGDPGHSDCVFSICLFDVKLFTFLDEWVICPQILE